MRSSCIDPSTGLPVTGKRRVFLMRDLGQCYLWLRADNFTVAQWNDMGGKRNHAVQATGGNQGSLNASDAGYGGKPTVTFGATARYVSTFSSQLTQPNTIYIVGQTSPDASADYRIVIDGVGVTNRQIVKQELTSGVIAGYAGSQLNSATSWAAKHAVCWVANGASSAVYIDSTTAAASGAGGALPLDGVTLGCSYDFTVGFIGSLGTAKIAEVAVFSGAHSALQRRRAMSHLGLRYGITIS